ncbi:MFS transporter [Aquabacterium sp.]|uniref:MFS transporter n=1 Tax=Aquabacterium sp. TaxID=1872578 RepID=UPI002B891E76|nr:MFS transporter [Aquabacterium sp.]HSW05895.1 MFS transporter [Aquabacterium sp.]
MSVREKLAYGLGDFASNLFWQSISMFLMFFYTDVFGIGAAVAGGILFVARVADAVWDLFLGYAIDRTRTRWGRCRPYLLFAPPLLALAAWATFTVPALPLDGKVVYAYATYIALMLCYSLVNIPYSAMPALLSANPVERTRLAEYRMFMAFAGGLLVAAATLPLVEWLGGGDRRMGYQSTVLAMGVLSVLLFWACFAGTRERVAPLPQRPDLAGELKVILRSRTWWTLFAASLVQFTAFALPLGVAMYFLIYVVGHPEWASSYFVIGKVGLLLGVLASSQLTRRFCKRSVVIWTTALTVLALLALHGLDLGSRWQLNTWIFTVSLLGAIKIPVIWSMVADAADDIELQSGRRVVGLATSSVAFAQKFGIGLGAALSGLILSHTGYQPGAVISEAARQGIVLMIGLLPALLYAVMAAFYFLYPLDRARLVRLQTDLQARRAVAA